MVKRKTIYVTSYYVKHKGKRTYITVRGVNPKDKFDYMDQFRLADGELGTKGYTMAQQKAMDAGLIRGEIYKPPEVVTVTFTGRAKIELVV